MDKNSILNVSTDLKALVLAICSNNAKEINIGNLENISLNNVEQMKSLKSFVDSVKAKNADRLDTNFNETQNFKFISLQSVDNLFMGEIDSEISNLRKSILESDLIEAIIALPNQMFSNDKGFYCLFVLSVNKDVEKRGKIQIIDASCCYKETEKAGEKCKEISNNQINEIVKVLNEYKTQKYDFNDFILRSKVCNLDNFCIYEIEMFKGDKCDERTDENYEKLLIKTTLPVQEYFDKFLKDDYAGFIIDEEKTKIGYEIMIFDEFTD